MTSHENATRFPLAWPTGWKRTPSHARRQAAFSKRVQTAGRAWARKERLGVGDGLDRLTDELRRLGASNVVISSNLRVRGDGLPYAQQAKQLDDPGVAVYFRLKGAPRALACDKWHSAAENMAAIAGHIAAIRAQERYGVGTLEQAFAGYAALPPNAAIDWRAVLDFGPGQVTVDDVQAKYRLLARKAHPDAGGSEVEMSRLNVARDAALEALGVGR